ncbi:MAG: hypothetical protein WD294_02160 [Phycisphaeraceae bacterium]
MAAFDLRKTLKQISPTLRKQLFCSSWPDLAKLPWDEMTKPTQIRPLFDALQSLELGQKRDVQRLLKAFLRLKTNGGLKVLIEEIESHAPDQIEVWGEQKSRMDKVVWTYLNVSQAFEEAMVFARADELSVTRYCRKWPGVQCSEFEFTEARRAALQQALIAHYKVELRGEICEIHHYSRLNGAEYFFAYLPDWPENFMVFNQSGELAPLDVPTAFTLLFVYTPATGVLETIASGSQGAQMKLRRLFYDAACGMKVEDVDPERPTFELNHVLDDTFSLSLDTSTLPVERAFVTRLMVYPTIEGFPLEGIQLRFRYGMSWSDAREQLDRVLSSQGLTRDQVTVEELLIRVQCRGDGERRGRAIPIRVTPRACDLKSLDDDQLRVIGENCLKNLGIDRDRATTVLLGSNGNGEASAQARGMATSNA